MLWDEKVKISINARISGILFLITLRAERCINHCTGEHSMDTKLSAISEKQAERKYGTDL